MTIYSLSFRPQALEDIKKLKKTDKSSFNKLAKLLEELRTHPYVGTGKPEKLKYANSGEWSRRISQKHRLVYRVYDDEIRVRYYLHAAITGIRELTHRE